MELIIEIPCKPIVKAYLTYNYGHSIKMNNCNDIGKFFLSLLQSKKTYHDSKYTSYTDSVAVVMDRNFCEKRAMLVITKTGIMDFNNFITNHFYKLMCFYVDTCLEFEPELGIKNAIFKFRKKFNVAEDILTYDTAKKKYYRYRKSLENKDKVAPNLSPGLSLNASLNI